MFNLNLEEIVRAVTVSLGSFCLWGPFSTIWLHTIFSIWSMTLSVCRMDLPWGRIGNVQLEVSFTVEASRYTVGIQNKKHER